MRLRTRKWGCALGITLLIAVPVALAVWLGQTLIRPRTMEDLLRDFPLYTGAHDIKYGPVTDEYRFKVRHHYAIVDGAAQLDYHVDGTALEVINFYADTMPYKGWISYPFQDPTYSDHTLLIDSKSRYLDGLWFGKDAPWVHVRQSTEYHHALIEADDDWRDGRWVTEITIVVDAWPAGVP
jgi:hypothetical protein